MKLSAFIVHNGHYKYIDRFRVMSFFTQDQYSVRSDRKKYVEQIMQVFTTPKMCCVNKNLHNDILLLTVIMESSFGDGNSLRPPYSKERRKLLMHTFAASKRNRKENLVKKSRYIV